MEAFLFVLEKWKEYWMSCNGDGLFHTTCTPFSAILVLNL